MNPSWKIDELARRVLRAAKWPGTPINDASPTPHLDELERSLEIYLPPLSEYVDAGGSSSVRTCTRPNGLTKEVNGKGSETKSDVWTWTPQTNTTSNTYSKEQLDDDAGTTLEELAPFAPEFYRSLGELVREAFHPGSVRNVDVEKVSTDGIATHSDGATHSRSYTHEPSTMHKALHSLEHYSLPRMMESVRITRILLSLHELNVGGTSENGKDCSFIESLLHYCEGMAVQKKPESSAKKDIASKSSNGSHTKGKRIPILSALFHHWSSLPQLEHSLQQLSRKYSSLLPMNADQYREYCQYCFHVGSSTTCESGSSSIGDGGSTGGEWKPSTSATSFLGDRALRIESFKMRIEEELNCHINGGSSDKIKLSQGSSEHGGLVVLLTLFYQSSDSTLRGKCRRWMGQWLRSFALGSGGSVSYSTMQGGGDGANGSEGDNSLGPSFASFCPLVMTTALTSASSKGIGDGAMATTMKGPISITHMGGGGGMPHNPLGMENTSASGVEALLRVLLRIIMGFRPLESSESSKSITRRSSILRAAHEHLLFDVILPLHRPSGMVLWRDQTPLIGLYHEALVKAIGAFLAMDRTLVGPIVGALLHPDVWPTTEGGNTPKVVLLLHEVDTLIGLLLKSTDSNEQEILCLASFDPYLLSLVSRLCMCISSENSRTSERALQFFRNKTFQRLIKRRLDEVGHQFIRALCRCPSREVPWNPTVRKMTLLVLQELEGYYNELSPDDDDRDFFGRACDVAFSGVDLSTDSGPENKNIKSLEGSARVGTHSASPAVSGDMTTLRGAMGSWKPPPKRAGGLSSKGKMSGQPPSTVTGVAPWAMTGQSRTVRPNAKASGAKQPPLTVTGVAPWAVQKQPHGIPSSHTTRKASISTAIPRPSKKHVIRSVGRPIPPTSSENVNVCIQEEPNESENDDDNIQPQRTSLDEVRSYMQKLKPKGDTEKSSDGISSWAKAQMEESPVLFPNLKFHDLVFGQDLGTGAFSTVKYARRIVKSQTRSNWPEYAVKIVSTQKIEELGYEKSINREIAILRTLSHPGISRLISSFRFRDGAYLILEYASGGDLHTLLRKNGSLDHDSTRFVIGSVAAALWSIHERGFVYADCKPENILITETGHMKVTDFGGCRPVTSTAKTLLKQSSKNLLKQLRDGDWKTNSTKSYVADEIILEENTDDDNEDLRIEGTTAYLPPEVVVGGFPTAAADVWALGCVLFQCISGRPPILEDTDDLTAQRIVTFDLSSEEEKFFGESDSSAFRDDAKGLIQRMLHRDVSCRPDILQVADAEFFSGMDIFNLHKKPAHPLDVGSIAPTSDAKWSRRQFSSIWAPQPRAYNIEATPNRLSKAGDSQNEPIIEGDEADEEFLPTQKAPLLSKIRE